MASRNIVIKTIHVVLNQLCSSLWTSRSWLYIWRGDLTGGFLRYEFGELIFGGAFTRRGLFSEFYGISRKKPVNLITLSYAAFASG